MSCPQNELKDYLLAELNDPDRQRVEDHLARCAACAEELERLRVTETALFALREEEPPRRIAFVSDPVFEPNWWQRFWRSGPQVGFAATAMLACAILVHAYTRPAVVTTTASAPVVDVAAVEARVMDKVRAQVREEMRVEHEARTTEVVAKAVKDAEKRFAFERQADMLTVEENFNVLRKQLNRFLVASNDIGGDR